MQSDVCYDYHNNGQRSLRGPRPIQQAPMYSTPVTYRQPRMPIEVVIPPPRTNFVPQPPPQPYCYPAPKRQLERKPSKTEVPMNDFIPPLPAASSSTKTIAHSSSIIRRKPTPPTPASKVGDSSSKHVYPTPLKYFSSDEEEDDMNDEDILRDLTLSRKKSVHDITISSDEEEEDEDYNHYNVVDVPENAAPKNFDDLPPIVQKPAPRYSDNNTEPTTSSAHYGRKNDLPPIPSISAPGYSDDEDEDNICKNNTPLPVIPTICVPGDFSDDEKQAQQKKPMKNSILYNSMYCGVRCGGCEEPLSGQAITTTGKHWHPRCFKCQACRQNLEHIAFYEKDSLPYCALDYHELFSPRCDFCKTPIEEHSISALGKTYHPGHFFCRECGKPFDEETNFLEHEGHAYCEADYYKQFGKPCKGCEEIITGDFLVALGGEWHKECFVCVDCGSTFASSTFLIRGGKPYCEEHYNQQAATKKKAIQPKIKPLKPLPSLDLLPSPQGSESIDDIEENVANLEKACHRCHDIITGRCYSAFGRDYHPQHFQCSKCDKLLSARLTGLYEKVDDNEIICKPCARKNRTIF
ncbi:hypothetical protein [Parasitella parasitica]|uniref:Paxillin n=1 Tax=Parasitella parasitica TaxID=35722 RepID=A0A0B7N899_9FUNG|nr:hypothetical protein [Parasitella parasitica]